LESELEEIEIADDRRRVTDFEDGSNYSGPVISAGPLRIAGLGKTAKQFGSLQGKRMPSARHTYLL
jgi:hypothetical protein